MKRRVFKTLRVLLAPVLSGVLLSLAFPKHDLGWLAWVGLVPLLIAISGKSSRYGFLLSIICGVIFFFGVFNWLREVPGYKFLHHSILAIYVGSYLGFFGLIFTFVWRRSDPTYAFLAAPFVWVSLEYVRANLSFLALPWPLLAHSQYQQLRIIQSASFTGAYGISFLVAAVNSALAAIIIVFFSRMKRFSQKFPRPTSALGAILMVIVAALLVSLTLLHGLIVLSKPIVGEEIKVSLLQGNIDKAQKWDPKYAKLIMETYADLSREAAEDEPQLIVWPEASTPGRVLKNLALLKQTTSLIRETKTYHVIGSSEYPKFAKRKSMSLGSIANTALFFSPEGKVLGQYLKIRLVPFGEYLPYKETVPWSYIKVPNIGSFIAGKKFTIFECPTFRFATIICWETIFPDLVRQFVKEGAQFIINITNEAWFGATASYHVLVMSVFRAIENQVYMLRCANTGVSCFIDPYGRIVDRVKDANGKDLFVRGMLSKTLVPLQSKTIYTLYGDWLVWLSIACSIAFLIMASVRKNPHSHSK